MIIFRKMKIKLQPVKVVMKKKINGEKIVKIKVTVKNNSQLNKIKNTNKMHLYHENGKKKYVEGKRARDGMWEKKFKFNLMFFSHEFVYKFDSCISSRTIFHYQKTTTHAFEI